MTTRIIVANRVVGGSGLNGRARSASQVHARLPGDIVDTAPIPPDSPESPFRAGFAYHDPDDDLVYRIVMHLDIQGQGWGTAAFWMARYGVTTFSFIREWVARGWLDAAMEQHAPTKRFRCRDERQIYNALKKLHDTKNSIGPGEKSKIRHALLKLKPLFEAP